VPKLAPRPFYHHQSVNWGLRRIVEAITGTLLFPGWLQVAAMPVDESIARDGDKGT
jgi:hypothetical protein